MNSVNLIIFIYNRETLLDEALNTIFEKFINIPKKINLFYKKKIISYSRSLRTLPNYK